MVMSPEKCNAEHWDTMCFTVFTVSSGGKPCLPSTHILLAYEVAAKQITKHENEIDTNSVLRWCLSAPWPLTSACWLHGDAATSCWLYRPVSPSRLSPRGTDWARLQPERQDPVHGRRFFYPHVLLTVTYPKAYWCYSSVDVRWSATWFLDMTLKSVSYQKTQ